MTRQLSRQTLAAGAAAALTVGFAIVGAAPASANQVWHQSVGRGSADATCPGSNAIETSQGWSQWTPSWEQWMNDGQGGWVCTRSITWAKDSTPPGVSDSSDGSGDCIDAGSYGYFKALDFLAGNVGEWLPTGSDAYSDVACVTMDGTTDGVLFVLVTSPSEAVDECDDHGYFDPEQVADGDARLYACFD